MKIKSIILLLFFVLYLRAGLSARNIDSSRYIGLNIGLFYNHPTKLDVNSNGKIQQPISYQINAKSNLFGKSYSKRIIELEIGYEISKKKSLLYYKGYFFKNGVSTFHTINLGVNYLRKLYFSKGNKFYLNFHYSIGRLLSRKNVTYNDGIKQVEILNLLKKENNYITMSGLAGPLNYKLYDLRPDIFSFGLNYRKKVRDKFMIETSLNSGVLLPLPFSEYKGSQGAFRLFINFSFLF